MKGLAGYFPMLLFPLKTNLHVSPPLKQNKIKIWIRNKMTTCQGNWPFFYFLMYSKTTTDPPIQFCVKKVKLTNLLKLGQMKEEGGKKEVKDCMSGRRTASIDVVCSLIGLVHQGGLSWGLYCIPRQHRWQQKALRDQQIILPFLQQEGKLRGGRWEVSGQKKKNKP